MYRYPGRVLAADYVRAGLGFALTAGPALAIPAASAAQWVLVPLAGLFAFYGVRSWRRGRIVIEATSERLLVNGGERRSLAWNKLADVQLRYYSTKRDRKDGWMQLVLRGAGGPDGDTIRIDSTLTGFEEIVARAVAAARAGRIELSEATEANLDALGIGRHG